MHFEALFNGPTDVSFDKKTNALFVADSSNNCIRKISATGQVSTFSGKDYR
jgi:DNA-binding beta-propeller fold protein YncE